MAAGEPVDCEVDGMTNFLKIALLGTALVAVCPAQERRDAEQARESQAARSEGQQQAKRYYDKSARDYHEWNQDEDRRYHEYAKERHLRDRDFDRLSSRQQSDYFKWSHEHQPQRDNDRRP